MGGSLVLGGGGVIILEVVIATGEADVEVWGPYGNGVGYYGDPLEGNSWFP